MVYGGAKVVRPQFDQGIRIKTDSAKVKIFQGFAPSNYFWANEQIKTIRKIKMILNDKTYYELDINPLFKWKTNPIPFMNFSFFYNESDWMKDIKYILTFDDGTEEIHRKILTNTLKSIDTTRKAPVVSQYIVTLGKRSSPELYNDVWKSKTIEEGVKKLYGMTETTLLLGDIAKRTDNGFRISTKFKTDIKSMAIFGAPTDYPYLAMYPALAVLQTHAIDMQEEISLSLYARMWDQYHGTADVNITLLAQSKDNKLYKTVQEFKGVSDE